ncbi:MAG: hypothetical protein NDJ90_01950 [Oligoflexia bacterium]|nr:hypothetical protein [Oligoflexia bacterium]
MNTSSLERAALSLTLAWLSWAGVACTTLPTPKVSSYAFPKGEAFVGNADRPYETLGLVRTKVEYFTLDPMHEEEDLCRNYYNKAVRDLVKRAKEKGADAVIDVKTVVFTADGRQEFHPTAECTDEGDEGQVLAQGIAIRWKPEPGAPKAESPKAESPKAEAPKTETPPRVNSPFRPPGRQ